MDTLKEIESYLAQYFERGSTMSINELLDIQDKVSIHSYRLAEMAAEAKTDYNTNFFTRKITINRQMQSLINAKISKAAAQVQAESSKVGAEMMESEMQSESLAFKYDLLLNQVNKILSAIAQRVSFLKQEHKDLKA